MGTSYIVTYNSLSVKIWNVKLILGLAELIWMDVFFQWNLTKFAIWKSDSPIFWPRQIERNQRLTKKKGQPIQVYILIKIILFQKNQVFVCHLWSEFYKHSSRKITSHNIIIIIEIKNELENVIFFFIC